MSRTSVGNEFTIYFNTIYICQLLELWTSSFYYAIEPTYLEFGTLIKLLKTN